MQFQSTIKEKREEFRVQIRKEKLESIFSAIRIPQYTHQNNIDQSYENLIQNVIETIQKNEIQMLLLTLKQIQTKLILSKCIPIEYNNFDCIFNILINQNLSQNIIQEILLIAYYFIINSNVNEIEEYLTQSQFLCILNSTMFKLNHQDIELFDILLLILHQITIKSDKCKYQIIEKQYLNSLLIMIDQIKIEQNKKVLSTFFLLLSEFLKHKYEFSKLGILNAIYLLLNRLCKKLIRIHYFDITKYLKEQDIEEESELEFHITSIHQFLMLIKYYVDQMKNIINLIDKKSLWGTILILNFTPNSLPIFKITTSYIILQQLQGSQQIKQTISSKYPQLIEKLINQFDNHQIFTDANEKIKLNTAKSLIELLPILLEKKQNQNYIQIIVNLIEQEKSSKVLPPLLQCFYLLLQYQPNLDYLSMIENILEYSFYQNDWPSIKIILQCIELMVTIDEMFSIKESKIGNILEQLSYKGCKNIILQSLMLLEKMN